MGNLLKNQKRKSLIAMKDNEINLNFWEDQDKKFLSLYISLIDDIYKFYAADFKLQEKQGLIKIINKFDWNDIIKKSNNNNSNDNKSLNLNVSKKDNCSSGYNYNEESKKKIYTISDRSPINQNILLKNKILRLKDDSIFLRSLCVECEINLLMSGESNFYIFSRCNDKFSEYTTICCISKELESARKFISFGVFEKNEDDFFLKFLKKQEIPHQDNHIKSLDISEIKFIFIDNGDNRCFVFLTGQEMLNSNLFLVGDFYVPIDYKSNLMFAVSGDLVSVQKLIIKQSYRNSYMNYRNSNTNDSIQSCSCCIII